MAEAAAMVEMGCSSTEGLQGSNQATEAEKVRCECCGISEECTPAYIAHIRGLYCGRWLCGLCVEAVKEERRRRGWGGGGGGNMKEEGWEEALQAHMSVFTQFNNPEEPVGSPVADISAAVRRLWRRSSDVRSASWSAPSSPIRHRPPAPISRANSCFDDFPQG